KVYVGMVTIVLSQFCTRTIFKLISKTSPSTTYFGISIQSPTRTESYADTCILATNPKIMSLNTSIKIAEAAPRETKNDQGELPVNTDTTNMVVMKIRKICTTCI